jgi:hypothetical protein
MKVFSEFTLHNNRGQKIPASDLLAWKDPATGDSVFGPIEKYSWMVDDQEFFFKLEDVWLRSLPDASGFIAFESDWKPDNCVLLDVYGKERMRLTVPWEMTGSTHPESAHGPTSFANTSAPYEHPQTGERGKFGVTAWVERMGQFYFELDYHSGKFLWCRQIRD